MILQKILMLKLSAVLSGGILLTGLGPCGFFSCLIYGGRGALTLLDVAMVLCRSACLSLLCVSGRTPSQRYVYGGCEMAKLVLNVRFLVVCSCIF